MNQTAQKLDHTFMALADPTRRAILAKLSQGEATVQELSAPFDISAPAITKHLKVLERAGLISRSREAQWRPCRIEPEALREVADWISVYKSFWEESFDRLDAYLKTITANKQIDKAQKQARKAKKNSNRSAKRKAKRIKNSVPKPKRKIILKSKNKPKIKFKQKQKNQNKKINKMQNKKGASHGRKK